MQDKPYLNTAISTAGIDSQVNNILSQTQTPSIQPAHQPGGFRRFLGAAVGMAANIFAPGMGGMLGNLLSGGLGSQGSPLGTDPNQYLRLQQEVDQQSEAFQTVSAVLKSKHDSAMAAINNLH